MRQDKIQAVELRRKGQSYTEIQKILKIPKSTLSLWLRDVTLSSKAQKRLKQKAHEAGTQALVKRNKLQTVLAEQRARLIIERCSKEIKQISRKELFWLGVSLYWAEGYKKGAYGSKWKCVDFTNADPLMIKVMMRFLREICKVPGQKIKAQVIIHKNINENTALDFWQKVTDIPKDQFLRPSRAVSVASKGKRPSMALKHGTIHIRVGDVNLFHKIIGWIEGVKKFVK